MKRLQTRIPASIPKERIDHFLMHWLPHAVGKTITKTMIRKLILSGSVYVNRHREKNPTVYAYTGAFIEVYYDEEKLNIKRTIRREDMRFDPSRIVFEDEWLIVVDKPHGIPSQPTVDPHRANLYQMMKDLLEHREKVKEPYVGLHHRLDKDTSGLILFTKKEEANLGVSKLFSEHKIQKTYQCLGWRSPEQKWNLDVGEELKVDNFIGKLKEVEGKTKHGVLTSGGDRAITHFKVIERFRDVFWMEAKPLTGRTHQIRVHCATMGLPILGDSLYFPQGLAAFIAAPRLMLHATHLEFIHPITQQKIELSAALPDEFVQLLGQLKA